MIEGKLVGMDRLEADLSARMKRLAQNVDGFVASVANDGASRIRAAMHSASSPSSPGSAPGIVTGNLIKSVQTTHERGSFKAEVQVTAPHWHLLEFGTSKMAARPFLRPQAKLAVIAGEARIGAAIEQS